MAKPRNFGESETLVLRQVKGALPHIIVERNGWYFELTNKQAEAFARQIRREQAQSLSGNVWINRGGVRIRLSPREADYAERTLEAIIRGEPVPKFKKSKVKMIDVSAAEFKAATQGRPPKRKANAAEVEPIQPRIFRMHP